MQRILVASVVAVINMAGFAVAADHPLQGTWTITTVGKRGEFNVDAKNLNSTFTITIDVKDRNKPITGKAFNVFDISRSRIMIARPGGEVRFNTNYEAVITQSVDWHGKLSPDGTKITDGKFSFLGGSGTFTAEKQKPETK